jgi:hypothetical protein
VVKRKPTIEADPDKGRRVHDAIVESAPESITGAIEDLALFLPPHA